MEDHILNSDFIEDDMNDILEDAFRIYISTFHPERSLKKIDEEENEDENEEEKNIFEQKIKLYKNFNLFYELR